MSTLYTNYISRKCIILINLQVTYSVVSGLSTGQREDAKMPRRSSDAMPTALRH